MCTLKSAPPMGDRILDTIHKSQKKSPAWLFALLWVLFSSSSHCPSAVDFSTSKNIVFRVGICEASVGNLPLRGAVEKSLTETEIFLLTYLLTSVYTAATESGPLHKKFHFHRLLPVRRRSYQAMAANQARPPAHPAEECRTPSEGDCRAKAQFVQSHRGQTL